MQESNKFLGMDKGNLPILALSLITLAVIIILFDMQTSAINRLDANISAMRSEQREDSAALRSEMKEAIRELSDDLDALEGKLDTLNNDVDALGSGLNALKIDTAEIKVRVEEIERRMSPLESVDGRLDEFERELARLKERVDALPAESE